MFIDCCRLSSRKLMLRWRSGSRKLLGSALLITLHGGISSTPVFLPGEFYGQRSLVGYSPWGHKESDMTEWLGTGMWGKGGRRDEAEGQVGLYSADLLVISDAGMALWSCPELAHSGQPCAPSPWIEAALGRHMPFHETTLPLRLIPIETDSWGQSASSPLGSWGNKSFRTRT